MKIKGIDLTQMGSAPLAFLKNQNFFFFFFKGRYNNCDKLVVYTTLTNTILCKGLSKLSFSNVSLSSFEKDLEDLELRS